MLKVWERSGSEEPPAALANMPIPEPGYKQYWQAFCFLLNFRARDMNGNGHIPLQTLLAWLDEQLIFDLDDREIFTHVIVRLDRFLQKIEQDARPKT